MRSPEKLLGLFLSFVSCRAEIIPIDRYLSSKRGGRKERMKGGEKEERGRREEVVEEE